MATYSPLQLTKPHFHANDGSPATGYRLYTYDSQSNQPSTLYANGDGTGAYGAYIELNDRGEPTGMNLYADDSLVYKLILRTAEGADVWTMNGVNTTGSGSVIIPPAFDSVGQGLEVVGAFPNRDLQITDEVLNSINDKVDKITTDRQYMNGDLYFTATGEATDIDAGLIDITSDIGGVKASAEYGQNPFVSVSTFAGEKEAILTDRDLKFNSKSILTDKIVKVAVDGSSITGDGTTGNPLVAHVVGAGDMTKAVYDTNNDGTVNSADYATTAGSATNATNAGNADTLDSYHASSFMLKSTYDSSNSGIVDASEAVEHICYFQETIAEGEPFYITSGVTPDLVFIGRARSDDANKMPASGVALQTTTAGNTGKGLFLGIKHSLNTGSYSLRDTLYVAPTGGLTKTKPTTRAQEIGIVLRSGGGDGIISVNPQPIEVASTALESVSVGDGLQIDDTDPLNPIISADLTAGNNIALSLVGTQIEIAVTGKVGDSDLLDGHDSSYFATASSVVTVHNDLTSKQGGTTNEYYHQTASENLGSVLGYVSVSGSGAVASTTRTEVYTGTGGHSRTLPSASGSGRNVTIINKGTGEVTFDGETVYQGESFTFKDVGTWEII